MTIMKKKEVDPSCYPNCLRRSGVVEMHDRLLRKRQSMGASRSGSRWVQVGPSVQRSESQPAWGKVTVD